MNAGERAIAKEKKLIENERRKQIRLANKMLIPVSKKTTESLKILSFDPSGVFRLTDERWLKIYRIKGNLKKLVSAVHSLDGCIRVTQGISESDRVTCHLTLMETGEIYEEVRQKILKDETELSKVISIQPLSIDEAMCDIASCFRKDSRFSYASMVRGNKDWKKECFFTTKEEAKFFWTGNLYGVSFLILSYPANPISGLMNQLRSLACQMYVSFDLNALTGAEQTDFVRAIEKKYNRRLSNSNAEDYINLSMSTVIFADSKDAAKIVEDTVLSIFLNQGYLIVPAFHNQTRIAESILSLGLMDYKVMRNVEEKAAEMILGGEENADAEDEI